MRLIIVEDSPGDAELVKLVLQRALSAEDNSIEHVRTMRELEELGAQGAKPDVVLLDIGLPDSEGVDSVRRAVSACQGAPVIVLTGHDNRALAMECIGAGAQDYIPKNEMSAVALRRAVVYGVGRLRERRFQ